MLFIHKRAPNHFSCPGLGTDPSSNVLSHMQTFDNTGSKPEDDTQQLHGTMVPKGAGLPPVPAKLVKRILAGEYVDMSELLPDSLGVSGSIIQPLNDKRRDKRPRRRQVAHILEWLQCFSIYMATERPNAVWDLLGYQTLILEARM